MKGIEIKNITKNFGNVCALQDVSFNFEGNKIYGLLGRNGAGKTTLLNIITNKIFPDSGEVLIDGQRATENDEVLQRIYMMSEKNYFPEGMTVKDAFKWSWEFYKEFDKSYALDLAKEFSLDVNKKVKSLSTGYSSIYKMIISLSANTPYMLFDEPVLGLDANYRDLFYKVLIQKYSDNPCTVVISTHLIEEISDILEHIVIIDKGEVIADAPKDELLSKAYVVSGSTIAVDNYISGRKVLGSESIGGLKTAFINESIDEKNIPEGIEISRIDLQKMFIYLTNS